MLKNDNIYKSLTIALILSFIFLVWWCIDLYNMDDKELYRFVYKDRSKGAGILLILVYKYFGKIGLIIEPWPLFGFLLFCWFGEYQTYKKEKAIDLEREQREQEKLEQLSKRKSWRKKQEQKRRKQEQKRNKTMKTNLLIILSLLLAATSSQAQPYLAALSKPGKLLLIYDEIILIFNFQKTFVTFAI